jgi:hypothetical protein
VPRPRPHRCRVPVVDVQAQRLRRGRRHGGHEQRPKQRRHSRPRHGKGKQSKDKTAAFAARNMERSARLPAAIYPGFVREPGEGKEENGTEVSIQCVRVPAASARWPVWWWGFPREGWVSGPAGRDGTKPGRNVAAGSKKTEAPSDEEPTRLIRCTEALERVIYVVTS